MNKIKHLPFRSQSLHISVPPKYGFKLSTKKKTLQQPPTPPPSDTNRTFLLLFPQSIIRKVRSRVSSIIPDALSKWFSPSAVKRPREMAESSSSPPPVATAGRNGNLLRQLEEQHQQEEEGEEDEDEAPPTRKKKRVEERFVSFLGG